MQGDVIVNRILNDAQLKASEILEEVQNKVNEINLQIEKFAERKSKEVTDKLEDNSKQIQDRYSTLAKIEGNKILLNEKQKLLKDLKKEALNALLQLKKEDMISMVEKLIKENANNGETLLVNITGITINDIQELNVVKSLNLNVIENKNEKEIGLILSSKTCDKNLLFSQLVEDAFEQNQAEINAILFN